MIALQVQHLTKRFPNARYAAVNDISFALEDGHILALLGPSGCGKTTTLRLVAGLDRPDTGSIQIKGQMVVSPTKFIPPEQRGVGMVFQDHALFPHLSVFDNIAFGLRGRPRSEIRQTTQEMLHLVGLQALSSRFPHALSGGERQRVALARALAPRPVLVLLDEPFSSLDADMRLEVREHVRSILKSLHTTVVFVTHDQEEALFMGDRLAVFHQGCLEQIGTPEEVFHAPTSHFVAEFMGDSDFLAGRSVPEGIHTEVGLLPQPLPLPTASAVEVALRADDVDFKPAENGNGVIIERFFRGAFNLYRLRLDSGQVLHAFKEHNHILPAGTRIQAYISAGHPLAVFKDGRAAVSQQ